MNKFVNEDGYIECYIPDHPYNNRGYVLEHRLIMESVVGFYLSADIVVHHIDFNKQHNVADNLFLTTAPEHSAIHNRYQQLSLAKKQRISQSMRKNRQRSKTQSSKPQ